MSYDDELKDFMEQEEMTPERAFAMVTLVPKRKVKVSAFLEDKDGERVSITELAEEVVTYIEENMTSEESSAISTQFFPLINRYMTSVVPRVVGFQVSEFMFTAGMLREAISYFGLAVALLMQYIHQHDLKIVTEEETITDEELEEYMERSKQAEASLARALGGRNEPEEL